MSGRNRRSGTDKVGTSPRRGRERDPDPPRREDDDKVDEAIDESFPASDPPAYGPTTGVGGKEP